MSSNGNIEPGPRATAVHVMAAWLRDGVFPDRLLGSHPHAGRAAARELVYGAVKWRRVLEWRIQRVAKRPPRRDAAAILLITACELFLMDHSPPRAAVHSGVAIAGRMLSESETRFVNAILRGMLRDQKTADAILASSPAPLRLSHPDLLWQRWERHFGSAAAERLCVWNNGRARVSIRPQRSGGNAAGFLARLRSAGIAAAPHPARPSECLLLPGGMPVADLPGYAQGDFSVQDPATLMAVDLLNPRPGEKILDACAAPGGKTTVLADRMADERLLTAMDCDPQRIVRLHENLRRHRRPGVTVLTADLTALAGDARAALRRVAPAGFDAVLLDVPCSNTGVLRRRPDARWRFSNQLLAALTSRQKSLLTAGAACLKPGGRLIYSTCSLEPEENHNLVSDWLSGNQDFRLDTQAVRMPPESGTDGAYVACLASGRQTGRQNKAVAKLFS